MPKVELLGREVEVNPLQNKALLVAGLGVIAILWLARRRGAEPAGAAVAPVAAPPIDYGPQVEFARLAQETDLQTAALAASNKLEMARLDLDRLRVTGEQQLAREQLAANFALQAGQQPQRQCIPWGNWFALSAAQQGQLLQQVTDGALLVTPSGQGMCFTPTERGRQGSQPQVTQTIRSGIASSRTTIKGPAGSVPTAAAPPRSTLDRLLDAATSLYGVQTGAGAPGDLPPGVIIS